MDSKCHADAGRARCGLAALFLLAAAAAALPRAALAAAPDFKTEYDKGVAAFKAGDAETALAQFEKAYKIKKHPLCLFGMAQAHRKLGHLDAAASHYEKFLATKPTPEMAKEVRGYLDEIAVDKKALAEVGSGRKLSAAGDFAGAAAAYERAFALRADPETLFSAATMLERAGERARARAAFERYVGLVPTGARSSEAREAVARLAKGAGSAPPRVDDDAVPLSDPPSPGVTLPDDEPAPAKRSSKTGLWIGIGAGAAVVLGGGAVAAWLLLRDRGPEIPVTDFGTMRASF